VSSDPSIYMLKNCHVTSCGTPEQPKGLTNSDLLNGYAQNWVPYWVCVPSPSLELWPIFSVASRVSLRPNGSRVSSESNVTKLKLS
jgi:hypothetical protein